MQVLEAGAYKYLLLELDPEFVANIARQAGFEFKIDNGKRTLSLDLLASDRQAPLLLFDAADQATWGGFRDANSTWTAGRARSCKPHLASRTSGTARDGLCRTP
jgi:hypothetical protein